ncbi:MAG: hypothetical protein EA359_02905 [Balneolaceae bacterium]|nr:MAG: hypothetical protein EA359_02905 [Balneolaceae bacterium]
MKILYGIQGTGHGHISRAREILPLLSDKADVDVLISGYNCNMNLGGFEVTQKRGISLAYDSSGGVSYLQTVLEVRPFTFIRDVRSLEVDQYNLVISDYEPVTAWASMNKKTPCIALSHQAAFLSEKSPRPKPRSVFAEQILKNFAPSNKAIGFHFRRYDSFILPPIIRQDVLNMGSARGEHITVYLPAYHHDMLISCFSKIPEARWNLFSPSCKEPFTRYNVTVQPVGNIPFLKSLTSGMGVFTSGGFETCAEAMHLGKKLMVLPIRNQYEQLCNAAALKQIGITVINKLDATFPNTAREWINNTPAIQLNEVADTEQLTEKLIRYAQISR